MTAIGYFSRQATLVRSGKNGQATVLFLVVASTLISMICVSVALQNASVAKVVCSNAVDAVALNAATWEARSLNMIAALNDGVLHCLKIIRWTCIVWAAMAIAAAFGVGIPAFVEYTRYARNLIRGNWETAHQLAAWTETIRDAAPYLVLGETVSLARKRNVAGILFPADPRGPHDGKNTLELHLEPGPPIHLADALAPVTSALKRLKKIRFLDRTARTVISLLDGALRGVLGNVKGPIRMLVPEKDFAQRQLVRFAGSQTIPALPLPFLLGMGKERVFAEAQAEPYGGGSAEMTWNSRLTERDAK